MSVINIIRTIRAQLAIAIFLALVFLLTAWGVIPPPEVLIEQIVHLFNRHGLPIVAFFSFVENVVGVNAYFPGSIVILSSMALTAGNPTLAVLTFLAIFIPALFAQVFSYLLGKRFQTDDIVNESLPPAENKNANSKTWLVFLSTFWHPHLAALTCIAAGSEGVAFKRFVKYLLPTSLVWNSFWGITMYTFGNFIKPNSTLVILFVVYLIVWAAWDVYKLYKKQN